MVQAQASVKHIRVTATKARRVVNMIRGKQATEALAKSLSFGESMPARPRPGIGRDCKTKT